MSITTVRSKGRDSGRIIAFVVSVNVDGDAWYERIPVTVSVEYAHLQAKHLNMLWEAEQVLAKYRRFVSEPSARMQPLHAVTAQGLRIDLYSADGDQRVIPVIEVIGHGALYARVPVTEKTGLAVAWERAVHYWAEVYNIEDKDRDALVSRPPEPEQFKALRRHLNDSKGRDIGVDALRPVFRDRREAQLNRRAAERTEVVARGHTVSGDMVDVTDWFEREKSSAS